jgi:putative lumazine-binding protein
MKRSVIGVAGVIVALSAFVSVNTARDAADREAVEKPLKMYFSGDPEQLKQAFHPGATMFFARNDSLIAVPIPEYIARVAASRAQGGPPPQRTERIAQVDITGTSAVARLELEYPQQKITDYMSLVKYGGEWKIVNKIFSREMVQAK